MVYLLYDIYWFNKFEEAKGKIRFSVTRFHHVATDTSFQHHIQYTENSIVIILNYIILSISFWLLPAHRPSMSKLNRNYPTAH